jgi:hypothetical protein
VSISVYQLALFLAVGIPLAVLAALFLKPAKERRFEQALASRPQLDDDTFYETFYGGTDIPRAIPVRLRRLYAAQLGRRWLKVFPRDNPALVCDDLDFADLLTDVGQEFGVAFPPEARRQLDGSFDSVVKYLAEQVGRGSAEAGGAES